MNFPTKYFGLILALVLPLFAIGQHNNSELPMSINDDGAAPAASAIFDVSSSDKGILIPRMTYLQRNQITSPELGLLIYQTNSNKGFWYFDGSSWVNLSKHSVISDNDNDTNVDVEVGNDSDYIRLRTGGTDRVRINSHMIEVLNTGSSVFLGENAGLKDDLSSNKNTALGQNAYANCSLGSENTAVGYNALFELDHGFFNYHNTAVGATAMSKLESGYFNTAIGSRCLSDLVDGGQNVAVGTETLQDLVSGTKNIAIGSASGHKLESGSDNIIIGNNTKTSGDPLYSCNNSIKIGRNAGYKDTTDYKLFIGNTTSKYLVYGDFLNDEFRVNGTIGVEDEYTFPATDGNNNEFMMSDGNGNITWSSAQIISDDDNDTKILVEEAPDEDVIRFYNKNKNYISFDKSRIVYNDNGGSIFLGKDAGLDDNLLNHYNIGIGFSALKQSKQNKNCAIGWNALSQNVFGVGNVALGAEACQYATAGRYNTGIGYKSMPMVVGDDNTGVGTSTLLNLEDGDKNVAIGVLSGLELKGGHKNVIIGGNSSSVQQIPDYVQNNSVKIGFGAGQLDSTDYALHIGNTHTKSLISGNFNTNLIDLNGTTSIRGIGSSSRIELRPTLNAGQSRISLGEDSEGDYHMDIIYNGSSNIMEFEGNALAGQTNNILTLKRSSVRVGVGRIATTNEFEVEGQASKATTGAWLANSDRRLKKNINTINGRSALDLVEQMRGVYYEWDDQVTKYKRPTGIKMGFIAQELQDLFPDHVKEDGQGYLMTAYGDFDPLFVQAIKELNNAHKQKIGELENQIANLQDTVEQIQSRLAQIMN